MEQNEGSSEAYRKVEKKSHKYWWWVGLVLLIALGFLYYYYPELDTNGCISVNQARNDTGKNECVAFRVGYTDVSSAGNTFLDQYQDYSRGFEVWIPSGNSFGPDLANKYDGKVIHVTGTISQYHGAPEIIVNTPTQISSPQLKL